MKRNLKKLTKLLKNKNKNKKLNKLNIKNSSDIKAHIGNNYYYIFKILE